MIIALVPRPTRPEGLSCYNCGHYEQDNYCYKKSRGTYPEMWCKDWEKPAFVKVDDWRENDGK